MKIVFIHRQSLHGRYSIETLFHALANELIAQGEEVIEYEVGSRFQLISDVLALRNLDADVYHITGDINYLLPLLPWSRSVLTVHDIGHYLYSLRGVKRWLYKWVWLLIPIYLARVVTVVSSATKEHCIEYLGLRSKRIKVIKNCVNPIYQPIPKTFNNNCPRILQVGTKPYKNVPRLISALRDIQCKLVLVGKLDEESLTMLAKTGVVYENHVGLSQSDLLKQYAQADLVSFVSIGEGFGVPVIEAQAIGRPLITSNIPPMSVAAGDGAYLADPLDVESIQKGVLRIVSDGEYRAEIVRRGYTNVAQYSVKSVAKAYLAEYCTMKPS